MLLLTFCASVLQAIDSVMPLTLYTQVVLKAPQHFRSSETPATSGSIASIDSSTSRTVDSEDSDFSSVTEPFVHKLLNTSAVLRRHTLDS